MRQAGSSGESWWAPGSVWAAGFPIPLNVSRFLQIPPNSSKFLVSSWSQRGSSVLSCLVASSGALQVPTRVGQVVSFAGSPASPFWLSWVLEMNSPCMGIAPRTPCTAPHAWFPRRISQDQQGSPAGRSLGGEQRCLLLLASSGPRAWARGRDVRWARGAVGL